MRVFGHIVLSLLVAGIGAQIVGRASDVDGLANIGELLAGLGVLSGAVWLLIRVWQ
jgi:hypothetical protein